MPAAFFVAKPHGLVRRPPIDQEGLFLIYMNIETENAAVWESIQADLPRTRQIPVATYRMQFNRTWTFNDAKAQIPYLRALGISHIYASPYFQARPESMHGYDIVNHNALNPSIGSEEDYRAFVRALHEHGMGQILDTVPNHMGIGEVTNEYWTDVLENGPSSPYAGFFDIDWQPIKQEMANQLLLPILGDQYGRVLENQELKLGFSGGAFYLHYWDNQLPIAPRTYTPILQQVLELLAEESQPEDEHMLEIQSIITALGHLPARTETDPALIAERHREKEIIKRRLNTLAENEPRVVAAIEQAVAAFNGVKGDARSFDRLDELVRAQAYRLAYWRVAAEEINYRRFFDINDLAAIRMERPQVFEATHEMLLRLIAEGSVNGLRIDHPDGLWDPAGYFRNLQCYTLLALARQRWEQEGGEDAEQWQAIKDEVLQRYDAAFRADPHSLIARPLYVVAEKILGHGEPLPSDWTVNGTSGYEFLNLVNGLFVDGANAKTFEQIYSTFIQQRTNFNELVLAKKRQVMLIALVSEVNVLAHQLSRLAERNRYVRDFTLNSLTFALREVIACFPIYRTYIANDEVPDQSEQYIHTAINCAKRRHTATDPSIFNFIRDVLLLRYPEFADEEYRRDQQDWVQKFQQVTGPVMAKGLEDTAFYIYNRLISLNEVGGEPQHFGTSVNEFHRANQERLKNWPHTMLTTSTHDTKRSEDVRARINVLSELPKEWKAALSRWHRLNRRHTTKVEGRSAPDRNEQYLLYQTLLGAWPIFEDSRQLTSAAEHPPLPIAAEQWNDFVQRIQAYMQKALKEAKVNTSWVNPNEAWDNAVNQFVARILENSPQNAFLHDFRVFAARIADLGAYNAVGQALLKLTAPGVPDIYQGNDMWDFSLVDPDNRRPVDYGLRAQALQRLQAAQGDRAALMRDLLANKANGEIKLYVTTRALELRAKQRALFAEGSYTALNTAGSQAEHVVAFARRHEDQEVIVAVPRLLARITRNGDMPVGELWKDDLLLLPGSTAGVRYTNVFTDTQITAIDHEQGVGIPLADVWKDTPFAVLIRTNE